MENPEIQRVLLSILHINNTNIFSKWYWKKTVAFVEVLLKAHGLFW